MNLLTISLAAAILLAFVAIPMLLRAQLIGEREVGIVVKKFGGRPLEPGRLIALGGESGYQALVDFYNSANPKRRRRRGPALPSSKGSQSARLLHITRSSKQSVAQCAD